ncbi:MAG: hypothetical protein J0I54_20580 [Bosea sp.]|uniref:helix-turn-helix domain-containing protein n=1 Tax=unclassified Bosea (in: a-proteobacteria) TaxID=2653178 RepID=UPI00095E585F|nr:MULTISPECIES: hypothetical protein [unclassified Bosea (in: a-proteobacteria)]MBN9459036.1 hypothetical protein [Bosea sp. (in: a-proteobacteria)]OJV06222.1 MAG: hypothetical protein BGO20_08170 [Bosea sp. 67-29]
MIVQPVADSVKAEIVRRYQTGEPIAAIAAGFGVSIGYPAKLAKRRGVPLRQPGKSSALRAKRSLMSWKPEADMAPRRAADPADIRGRLLAGEPMLLIAADLDLGLDELVAAAQAAP